MGSYRRRFAFSDPIRPDPWHPPLKWPTPIIRAGEIIVGGTLADPPEPDLTDEDLADLEQRNDEPRTSWTTQDLTRRLIAEVRRRRAQATKPCGRDDCPIGRCDQCGLWPSDPVPPHQAHCGACGRGM